MVTRVKHRLQWWELRADNLRLHTDCKLIVSFYLLLGLSIRRRRGKGGTRINHKIYSPSVESVIMKVGWRVTIHRRGMSEVGHITRRGWKTRGEWRGTMTKVLITIGRREGRRMLKMPRPRLVWRLSWYIFLRKKQKSKKIRFINWGDKARLQCTSVKWSKADVSSTSSWGIWSTRYQTTSPSREIYRSGLRSFR